MSHKTHHSRHYIEKIRGSAYGYAAFMFMGVLSFLVPFDSGRNIDMQGLVLLLVGIFSWITIALQWHIIFQGQPKRVTLLLLAFIIPLLISLLVNPHKTYGLLGAPYIRLGATGFLACIGGGLLLRTIRAERLMVWLYGILLSVSLTAIPYNVLRFHSIGRIGGVFAQADILGIGSACGFLIGLALLGTYPHLKKYLIVGQASLLLVLFLTQTRAALFLLGLVILVKLVTERRLTIKTCVLYGAISVVTISGLGLLSLQRLTNLSYANESLRYRLSLQGYAIEATLHKPLVGYGPGNVADALACPTLHTAQLQQTCREGYFFNSSHDIFIDRILAIGWIGGLSFVTLTILLVFIGLRRPSEDTMFAYCALLIAGYYVTNVTNIEVELLLWICLLRPYARGKSRG
jgi:O-antigen ligase